MTSVPKRPLQVFLSYSHDSLEHADRIFALSDRVFGGGEGEEIGSDVCGEAVVMWPSGAERSGFLGQNVLGFGWGAGSWLA